MADIITDAHEFLVDTTLVAQWEDILPYPTTRKIYRHSSNAGSVIEFDYWGTPVKLFVADAKYRNVGLAYDSIEEDNENPKITTGGGYINGSADPYSKPLAYNKTDNEVQRWMPSLVGDGTAKSNTDSLMKFDTTEAAHHCRNQNISGIGQLDLPNLYELIILYLESDNIDALDPTAEANRDNMLGFKSTRGRFSINVNGVTHSSTESSSYDNWWINRDGLVYADGKRNPLAVVPVKELS